MTDYTSILILLNLVLGTLGGMGGFFWWANSNKKSPILAAVYGSLKTIILTVLTGAIIVVLAYLMLNEPLAFSNKIQQLQLSLIYLTPAPFLGSLLAYAASCYSLKLEKKRGSG